MNKTGLVAAVAEKTGFTKVDAEKAVKAAIETITEALIKGEAVQINGFGIFEVREKKASVAPNPVKPGEKIEVPAHKAPAFKAGAALKDAVK